MAEENKTEFPEAKNPLTREEADRMSVLIRLDIARYEMEAARAQMTLDQARYYVAQSEVALADIERRVANVDYPPVPETSESAPETGAAPETATPESAPEAGEAEAAPETGKAD